MSKQLPKNNRSIYHKRKEGVPIRKVHPLFIFNLITSNLRDEEDDESVADCLANGDGQ